MNNHLPARHPLDHLSDNELTRRAEADPDNPPLDDEFLERARTMRLGDLMPRPKQQVTLRLDADVLDWFKSQGKGWQTRINAVLKAFKESAE